MFANAVMMTIKFLTLLELYMAHTEFGIFSMAYFYVELNVHSLVMIKRTVAQSLSGRYMSELWLQPAPITHLANPKAQNPEPL